MLWEDNYVLVHWGIKGQRWGVRRFQNKDGSLTPEGKKRYYKTENGDQPDSVSQNTKSSRKLNAKKFLIGAGAVTLVAVAAYATYKAKQHGVNLSQLGISNPAFKKALSKEDNAHALISNLDNDFRKNVEPLLSAKEKAAIYAYSADDSANINFLLEKNASGGSSYSMKDTVRQRLESLSKPGVEKRCLEEIQTIEEAINKTSTKEDMVVNRKTKFTYVRGMFGDDMSAKELASILQNPEKAKGRILQTKGFCSTSVDPTANTTFGGCNLHIMVPKGSKGMYIAPIANNPKETEFLLQRGSKYRLVDVKQFTPDSESLYFSSMELFLELIS